MLLNSSEVFGTPPYLVMDPVHGGIAFFKHEQVIIDHPLFQRLRHIRQNDILHFVFPGATHTRLEHSIGTMHVAGRIFKSMIRNYLTNRGHRDLTKVQVEAIQYCYGCLRLAALLHDVGHMPFSHQFEEAKAGKELLSEPNIIESLWSAENQHFIGSIPGHLEHEHYSIRAACEIFKQITVTDKFPFELCDIVGMMEGGSPPPSERFCKSAVATLTLLSTVPDVVKALPPHKVGLAIQNLFKDIISGEIDADKMDYLLRDSYFSGCNYGAYNIDHLTQNICVGFDMNDPTDPWVGIAILQKGLGALEDFVHSRFRMYLQVYGHKTVVGLKWLVREAVAEILQDSERRKHIKEALSDMNQFATFTDTYCWEAFRDYAQKFPESACADLVTRRKLRHVTQIDDQAPFEKSNKRRELAGELNKALIQHECASRFSKINPTFVKLRLLVKNPITERFNLKAITSSSTFFSKFQDVTVTHYYEEPKWATARKGDNKLSEATP